MNWTQFNPVAISFGADALTRLNDFCANKHVLLVTSAGMLRRGTVERIKPLMSAAHIEIQLTTPNPDLDALDQIAQSLRSHNFECLVALGGGSVMDAAKALSLLLAVGPRQSLERWLRHAQSMDVKKPLPLVCVPSTAGTGAEVTPFATIWDTRLQTKRSLAHTSLYPTAALVEPVLTLSLGWQETLFGALDAMSHSLETLWNKLATPFSLLYARKSLRLSLTALPLVQQQPTDLTARANLQLAALLAGLAISQSKTALAHSISYPLTLHFGLPHGLACSITLVALIELVDRTGAWRNAKDKQLAIQSADLLRSLDLNSYLPPSCSLATALEHLDQMFTPDRADNFILQVEQNLLTKILAQSLHKTVDMKLI